MDNVNGKRGKTLRGKPRPLCSVPGCDRALYAKGLCHMHYQREWKKRREEKSGRLDENM